jgi:4-hydroxy-tetrahydrodipicolinate reductase
MGCHFDGSGRLPDPRWPSEAFVKIALFGYGRMGHAIETIALERGHELTLILDEFSNVDGEGILERALGGARMAIDFSIGSAVRQNVRRAAELGVSVVVGTTGWEEDRERVEDSVREAGTGLLSAPNFSIGMLLFARIVRSAARLVNRLDEYDVHLSETHHRGKIDHPSGTARRLAEILVRELDAKTRWEADLPDGSRIDPGTLHVTVARAGAVPGIHRVGIEGPDDRVELSHEARSRVGFARGAVRAAEWLENRSGVFTMEDVLSDLWGDLDP